MEEKAGEKRIFSGPESGTKQIEGWCSLDLSEPGYPPVPVGAPDATVSRIPGHEDNDEQPLRLPPTPAEWEQAQRAIQARELEVKERDALVAELRQAQRIDAENAHELEICGQELRQLLQKRDAEIARLLVLLREVWESVPATYEPGEETARHAKALNAVGTFLRGRESPGREGRIFLGHPDKE